MQQYQVEMIAQFDTLSNSSGSEENMLPYTPEQAYEQTYDQSYEQAYDQYYYGAYDTAYGYETTYAGDYSGEDSWNTNEELVCAPVPKHNNPASKNGKKLKVKKQVCQFWMKGCCERGVTCNFAHGEHQLGETVTAAPIATCKWWMQGTCRVKNCKYAHFRTDVEGELFATDLEASKLAAKQTLETEQTEASKKLSNVTTESTEARISNASQVSHSSVHTDYSVFAVDVTAVSAVTEAVPAFTKPQSVEEREQLMALLGNVMAALQ